MKDIRLSTEFWSHPKTIKLTRRLGLEGVRSLQILWLWSRSNRPDGILTGMDAEDIEIAAKWEGESERFVNESLNVRWLDINDGIYELHDWAEHNPWSADSIERGDKARLSRMAKTHPKLHAWLIEGGVRSISSLHYNMLKKNNESLTIVNEKLTPAPAPSPAPAHNADNTLCDESHDKGGHGGPGVDNADNATAIRMGMDQDASSVHGSGSHGEATTGNREKISGQSDISDGEIYPEAQSPRKQITQPSTQGDQDEPINTKKLPTRVRGNNHHDTDSAAAQKARSGHNPSDAGEGSAAGQQAISEIGGSGESYGVGGQGPPQANRSDPESPGSRGVEPIYGDPGPGDGNTIVEGATRQGEKGEGGIVGQGGAPREDMRDPALTDSTRSPRSENMEDNAKCSGHDGRRGDAEGTRGDVEKPSELQGKSSKRNGKSKLDLSKVSEDLLPVIEEFVEYRRADKKKPLTQRALNGALSGFAKSAEICKIPIQWVVEYAMIREWLTARPEWVQKSIEDIKMQFGHRVEKAKPKHLVDCNGCLGLQACRFSSPDEKVECTLYTARAPISQALLPAVSTKNMTHRQKLMHDIGETLEELEKKGSPF